jgi:hypothetical protein
MPRIIVTSESETHGAVTLDERVAPSKMEGGSESVELIERIGWALHDADEVEGRPQESRESSDRPPDPEGEPTSLAQVAGAVRDHEASTRRTLRPASSADRRLYRRLRQALER